MPIRTPSCLLNDTWRFAISSKPIPRQTDGAVSGSPRQLVCTDEGLGWAGLLTHPFVFGDHARPEPVAGGKFGHSPKIQFKA
ncbi:hypothetical protein SPHV1_630002 [Novosphingobium sp. KN65.2]|nr:hypothetical protein SPHV1_630002 [Novosphingobium sp. KN65.2]